MVQVDRGAHLSSGEWLDANRALWDERVPVHVASDFYDQRRLREGRGALYPIEEAELASIFPEGWEGKRVLHLQCHFGADSLALAQRGADVVGLDFSMPAIRQARALAAELGLSDRARFICANLYDARHMLPEPDSFDVVIATWGTIVWLPDMAEWARIVEWFLAPGGTFYFADGHPAALVFDDPDEPGAPPVFAYPYGRGDGFVVDGSGDYADPEAPLQHDRSFEWNHGLGEIVSALLATGLRLEALTEHDAVPWRMYRQLVERDGGLWTWPETPWLPLSVSITASKPTA